MIYRLAYLAGMLASLAAVAGMLLGGHVNRWEAYVSYSCNAGLFAAMAIMETVGKDGS
jgi:hypothetical protein